MKKIIIYLDTANLSEINLFKDKNYINGFTTNPLLMKKAKIKNYIKFTKDITKRIKNKPISFEIFADDTSGIINQGLKLGKLSKNIYVKVPIKNSKGKLNLKAIKELNQQGIKLNITAIFTFSQLKKILETIDKNKDIILSIFAGRIADTLKDPEILFKKAKKITKKHKKIKLLWASTREIFSIIQAQRSGADIITIDPIILKKLSLKNFNLEKYSTKTSKEFYEAAKESNYFI